MARVGPQRHKNKKSEPYSSKVLMSLLSGDYTALNASMIVITQLVERCEEKWSPH